MEVPTNWMISYDPGNVSAYAEWSNGRLSKARLGRPPLNRFYDVAVTEKPIVYPYSPIPPNDICTLRDDMSDFLARCAPDSVVVKYEPREWKGQVPKPKRGETWDSYIIHKRVSRALDGVELALYMEALEVVPVAQRHNIVDAVGIGLKYLRRM